MGAALDETRARPTEYTAEQRAAVDARDRDVFTEAGAGTGKTGVLVERYCDAVTEDGVGPDRILAFTFTERAAGELRERIRRLLVARARIAAERGDAERAAEFLRAARESERAWVTTIHGFCRRLLSLHPVAAGMDPRFRVLDEAEAARLAGDAFEAALEEVLRAGDGDTARFAAAFRSPRLRELVLAVHERLRSQGVDPPRLPEPGPPRRSLKDRKDTPELSPAEAGLAARALAALRDLLSAFHRHYEQAKEARSGADFEDLELRALDLLRASGPIHEGWRERFAHLMVDEFQDTNRVQLALIDALHGPQARLFVVGDEYQSIYRFRHADLEVFRSRRRAADVDAAVERRPLRGNFRSGPEVLGAIDFAGSALLDGFVPLAAGLPSAGEPRGGGTAAELLLTDVSEDRAGARTGWKAEDVDLDPPPSETAPAYVAEARFLAQRLRELADGGVPRGDMVVLLRAFTHVDAFEEALSRAGLVPYVVGGRGYWSQQQVEDVLRLLGVIANPLDDELLFGALASPACGASPDALWLLRQAARNQEGSPQHVWPTVAEGTWPAAMPAEDSRRLETFRDILGRLRAEAPLRPLDAVVDRAITAFDYDLTLLAMPNGRRRMANVRKLMRLAREYEDHDGRDLRGFLDFAEERTRRDDREGMAALQVEGHDGVRVMTVHAAKGLEFPVVAVADLGRGLGVGSRTPDIVIGRLQGEVGDPAGASFGMRLPAAAGESLRLWDLVELCESERDAEVEEACRLVYVAASRAQERLILSGSYSESDLEDAEELKAGHTALKLLLPGLRARGWSGRDGEVVLPRAPEIGGGEADGAAPAIMVRVQSATVERAAELRRRMPEPQEPSNGALAHVQAPLLADRPRPSAAGHLSYSALADYARCPYRFYVERVVGAGSALDAAPADGNGDAQARDTEQDELPDPALGPRERSMAIGNAVHAALEWSARSGWAEPSNADLDSILAREGLESDPEALARVSALLDGWRGSVLYLEVTAGGPVKAEVPFVLGLADTVVRGKMDLLVESEAGPLVVDYKTDALRGGDPRELADRYATQRDLYALAAYGRRERGATTIVRAAHCFLDAPESPVVHTYDASALEDTRQRLEQLVAGIKAGEFGRTESPHPSLCYGCPAAARLCGKPAWRPSWA